MTLSSQATVGCQVVAFCKRPHLGYWQTGTYRIAADTAAMAASMSFPSLLEESWAACRVAATSWKCLAELIPVRQPGQQVVAQYICGPRSCARIAMGMCIDGSSSTSRSARCLSQTSWSRTAAHKRSRLVSGVGWAADRGQSPESGTQAVMRRSTMF